MRSATRQIIGLDLVRFFAASAVMIFHLGYLTWAGKGLDTAIATGNFPRLLTVPFFEAGFTGVHVFFVISGIVIAYSAKQSSTRKFFVSRLVRLLPAIWIVAPITFVVSVAIHIAPMYKLVVRLARSLILFPFGPWIDGVYWTLSNEIAFYSIVLLLLYLQRFRWLEAVMAVVGTISVAFAVAKNLGIDPTPQFVHVPDYVIIQIRQLLLFDYGCFFSLGVFLFLLFLDRVTPVRVAFSGFLVIGCIIQLSRFDSSVLWLGALIAIVASLYFNLPYPKIARLSRVLGLATYPLYLIHNIVGAALMGFLYRAGINPYLALACSMAAVIGLAILISATAEPALQFRLRTYLSR